MSTQQQQPHWLNTKAYPFASQYLQVNGHRLHYIDEGQGDILLFVHGTPSWSWEYRHQIQTLSKTFRCVALDHMGFGLSDKPADYDYSIPNHIAALEALVAHLQLKNITLVVHDFGGPIGLGMALRQAQNIKQLIVLNTWLWDASDNPDYQKMVPILKSPLLPILYRWFNFSPKVLLKQGFHQKQKLTKALHQHYLKPFGKPSERNGTLAFAKSLLNDQAYFGQLWQQIHRLADKPTLFIWGMQDQFFNPDYLTKFLDTFSQHTVVRLKDAGHFPQEECAEAVTQAMRQFLSQSKGASTPTGVAHQV